MCSATAQVRHGRNGMNHMGTGTTINEQTTRDFDSLLLQAKVREPSFDKTEYNEKNGGRTAVQWRRLSVFILSQLHAADRQTREVKSLFGAIFGDEKYCFFINVRIAVSIWFTINLWHIMKFEIGNVNLFLSRHLLYVEHSKSVARELE